MKEYIMGMLTGASLIVASMLTRFVSDVSNDNTFHEINWSNQSERWVAK